MAKEKNERKVTIKYGDADIESFLMLAAELAVDHAIKNKVIPEKGKTLNN